MADIRTNTATKAPDITVIRTSINTSINIHVKTAMATTMGIITENIPMKEVTKRFNSHLAFKIEIYLLKVKFEIFICFGIHRN